MPVTAAVTSATVDVSGALRTFSATLDAAAATAVVAAATEDFAFTLLDLELDAAGGLEEVLAFFFFFSMPNMTISACYRTSGDTWRTCSDSTLDTVHNLFTFLDVLGVIQAVLPWRKRLAIPVLVNTKFLLECFELCLLSFLLRLLASWLTLDVFGEPDIIMSGGITNVRTPTYLLASLIVLRRRPLRSRQESLLLVFWLLMRPPAARSCEPKPPLPPRRRGMRRSVTSPSVSLFMSPARVSSADGIGPE